MCGIVGILAQRSVEPLLLDGFIYIKYWLSRRASV